MGIGKVKIQNHKEGFRDEIYTVTQSGRNAFFNWFNESGGDCEMSFLKGECDFAFHILLPCISVLKHLDQKVVLEIGYGGGRLLLPAARLFKEAIGIDVHTQNNLVAEELKRRGQENVKTLVSNGDSITVPSGTIDFVYSFIVLQHVEHLSIFKKYFEETFRVLKKDGIAILYFGRRYTFSQNQEQKGLLFLDQFLEMLDPRTHRESFECVNAVNLKVSMKYVKTIAKQIGFFLVTEGVSVKLPNVRRYGGQNYVVLKK